ncbi:MAG: hypothetical protein IJW96_05365 [Clostridia bacterium]|nr:hypothetical protein [Clostridia bacterium]
MNETLTKKNGKQKDEKIGEALLKVALGYQVSEVTEEYAEVDGELKLTKRKKTKKDIPPDLKAVQLLLSSQQTEELSAWTDEELETERRKLLLELEETSKKMGTKEGPKKRVKKKKEAPMYLMKEKNKEETEDEY